MPTADSKTPKIVGKEELAHLIAVRAYVALTETVREEVAKGHQVRLMGFWVVEVDRHLSTTHQIHPWWDAHSHPYRETGQL